MPYAVIACSVVFFWVISLRAYLFTVLPTIAADLAMSAGTAGALVGLTSLGYTAVVWSAGFLPGRPKRVILAGVAASLLGLAAVGLAPGREALFAAAILAGAGGGVYLPLGLAIIVGASRPGQRSRNMGVHEVSATAGYFCGAGFVAVALGALDWRQATLAWCVVGVLAIAALLFLRDDPVVRPRAGATGSLRLDAVLLACLVVFGSCQILLSGLTSVLPLVLVQGWSVSQAEAAAVVSWSRLAGLVGIAVAGTIGDRLPPATVVRGFFALAILSTGTMAVVPYGLLFVAAVFSLAAAASGGIVLVSVVVAQAFPEDIRSRALSLSNGLSGVISLAILPAVFGGFVERGWTTAPFLVAAAASLAAAWLVGLLVRRQYVGAGA